MLLLKLSSFLIIRFLSLSLTGLAGYPHLHFVVTSDEGWEYPYLSIPHNYRNTTANVRGPESGATYTTLPY